MADFSPSIVSEAEAERSGRAAGAEMAPALFLLHNH